MKFHRYNATEFMARLGISSEEWHSALSTLGKFNPVGPWLCGGAVRRLVSGQKLTSDFDCFFATEEQRIAFVRYITMTEGTSNPPPPVEQNGFVSTYMMDGQKIQVFWADQFKTPEEVLSSFDYTICQCAFDGVDFIFGEHTLFDIASKRLMLNEVTYATSTVRRMLKYANQGYFICPQTIGELLKRVAAQPEIIQELTAYID